MIAIIEWLAAGIRLALPRLAVVWLFAFSGLVGAFTADVASARLADFAVLVDADRQETIDSMVRAQPARFKAIPGSTLSEGYGKAAYWLRFTLEAPAGEWIVDVLPPFLNDVRLYAPDASDPAKYVERRSGNVLPFAAREIDYRGFAFKVVKANALPQTYYLRVETTSSIAVNVRVWAPAEFNAMATREAILLAGSLALLLTVMFLNLIHWLWMREPLLPWFIAYTGSLVLTTVGAVTGFFHQYLMPDHPEVGNALTKVAFFLAFAMGTRFFRDLFGVDRSGRWLKAFYSFAFWLPLALIPPSLLGYHGVVSPPMLMLTIVITGTNLHLAIQQWRRGAPGAFFAFAANVIAAIGILSIVLTLLGVIRGGLPALYGMQIGSLGTVVALHLAIGARLRALREERRKALAEVAREKEVRESQSRFIDLLAHEYRTPLAVLQTNVDILALTKEETQREEIRSMRLALRRLNELFASAQRNREWDGLRQIHVEAIDPLPLLRRLVDDMDTADRRHAHRLVLESPGSATILGDASVLQTVLNNLLDNAAKYATRGSTVDVLLRITETDVAIVVANACEAGHGLSADDLLRYHTRGQNTAGQPGMGMGLYLAERLVREMRGTLRLDVDPPERFVVTLTFPRALQAGSHDGRKP